MVDDADYEYLSRFRWHAVPVYHKFPNGPQYALRGIKTSDGKCHSVYMHRVILGAPSGLQTDHKNHDTLDNRKQNLRTCTASQNQANQQKTRGEAKFKGAYYHKKCKKWVAQIQFHNKRLWVGVFDSEIEAAKAYDVKAKELFGGFARLNLPEDSYQFINIKTEMAVPQ